jgi:hypothetical protein
MSINEYRALAGKEIKPTKYRNVKTVKGGRGFASKLEAARFDELTLMKQAGVIRWFNCQPSFEVGPRVRYKPDFIVCGDNGQIWVEDAKGKATKDFIIKAKLFNEKYPDIELRIVR